VGAFYDDDNGADSGSVYVFVRSGSSWTQQAKLTASDNAAGDQFGQSVAVSGDSAVVGAFYDDDNGADSGSVYVFVRSGSSWTQQAKLTASDGAAEYRFGRSVAISGDTAVVGAFFHDETGSAYVYTVSDINPSFIANKTEVDVGEVVTFTNLTTGGTHPYSKAEWDFDADGTPEMTLTGTETQVMADITHTYDTPGLYTVRLSMTDNTLTIRYTDMVDYITVSAPTEPTVDEPSAAKGFASIAPFLETAYGFKKDEGVGGWTVYNPLWPAQINTLTTLYVARGYWINVNQECILQFGSSIYELDVGWNLIGWIPQS
ncbi:PKD domain-containing protein, partial [Chloroflexota bacterium]